MTLTEELAALDRINARMKAIDADWKEIIELQDFSDERMARHNAEMGAIDADLKALYAEARSIR
jgi:hypothetical protein